MRDAMVDLETMGNGPTAAIIAVGAVQFDPVAGVLGDEFYAVVDLASSVAAGLRIEPATVLWWLGQSDEARAAVAMPGRLLADVLRDFAEWLPAGARVWGNGAGFDNVVLASAYRALGMPVPWHYRDDRCYRTLCALNPDVGYARSGTAHNALHDARSQAKHALELLAYLHEPADDIPF